MTGLRGLVRPLALVAGFIALAGASGCGGAGAGARAGGVSGYVFEGLSPEGAFSGRPVSGATVVYRDAEGQVSVTTDGSGFFAVGRSPAGAFDLHVVAPTPRLAAFSVFGLPPSAAARPLSLYLSLREPAGGPPPRTGGGTVRSAVRGRLVDASGSPQPGAGPGFGSPGDPGTLGFVWWGRYGAQTAGCPRCYSAVSGPDGSFDVQGVLGGELAGRTHPFFAGNYDGAFDAGRVLHYTQFHYRPAVDVLDTGPADLDEVRMGPVSSTVSVLYETSASGLVSGYGSGGLSYTFVSAYVSIAGEPLQLAEAAAGPAVGGGLGGQPVPVPQLPEGQSTYLFATALAFDVNSPVTAEFALTTTYRVSGGPVRVGYLVPPRSVRTGSGSRRILTWQPPSGATLQYAAVTDPSLVPVWEGLLGGAASSAALPVDLRPGSYYAFVWATDGFSLEEVVSGARRYAVRFPRDWRRPGARRPLLDRVGRPALDRTPFPGNMVRESYSDLVSFTVP